MDKKTFNWLKNFYINNNKQKKINSERNNKKIIDELLRRHILARRNDLSEKNLIFKRQKTHRDNFIKERKLLLLGFCVTDECNFRCSYCVKKQCDLWFGGRKNNLGWQLAKKRIDEFSSVVLKNKSKTITIGFGGGEPLLAFSLIKKIVFYTKNKFKNKKIVKFSITTNGSLINEALAKFLSFNNFSVGISLDGLKIVNDVTRKYSDKSGTFNDIVRGLNILLKYFKQKKITVSAVISSDNVDLIKTNFLNFLKKLGIKEVFIEPDIVNLVNCEYENLFKKITQFYKYGKNIGVEVSGHWSKPFKNIFRKKPIAACTPFTGESIAIDTLGRISPCIYLKKYHLVEKLDNIFLRRNYLDFLQKTWIGNIKECDGCIIEGFCLGGCYLSRISKNRKVLEYRCLLFKDMTEFLIKDFIKDHYSEIKKQLN